MRECISKLKFSWAVRSMTFMALMLLSLAYVILSVILNLKQISNLILEVLLIIFAALIGRNYIKMGLYTFRAMLNNGVALYVSESGQIVFLHPRWLSLSVREVKTVSLYEWRADFRSQTSLSLQMADGRVKYVPCAALSVECGDALAAIQRATAR